MKNYVAVAALADFVGACQRDDVPDGEIINQLQLYATGCRDVRLADSAIILLDGTVAIEPT